MDLIFSRKHLMAVLWAALFVVLFSANLAAQSGDSELEARAALESFLEAWNTADNDAIRDTLNYPHITHGPLRFFVANEPAQFETDFDVLRQQGWASSRFDTITPRQSSPEKVNFEVEYSRLNAAGDVISRGYVFYVVTRQDGHWGMQYRVPGQLQADSIDEPLVAVQREAIAMVDRFFVAFNSADNAALLEVNHVPQVMLSAGQYILAEDVGSPIVSMNFERMRERENWHSSELGDLEIVHVTPTQVIVELSFERFDPNGFHYLTGPAVWVLSKRNGKWGVEFRSLMSPTRHGI